MHRLKSTRLCCRNTTHQVKLCYRGYHYLFRFCWHYFMNVSLFSPSCHLYMTGPSTMTHTHTHSTSTTVKSPGYSTRAVKFVPPKKIRTKTWDTWVSKGIVRHNSNRKILFNPFLITQIYTCHKQTGFYTQLCQVMEKLVCHSTILPAWPMQKSHLMPCIRSHTPTSTTKLVGILVCKISHILKHNWVV